MSRQQSQQSSLKSTVSIVIPVYNEETQLVACLDAIACQTVAPFEVIVVDNNSTDQSVVIARRYPFVRVVCEPRQGVAYARTRGFDEARGDIIGRIDADTHLLPGWVAQVRQLFSGSGTDTDVDAVAGSIGFHDTPSPAFWGWVDSTLRGYLARKLGRRREQFLYGSNMAIRRATWQKIRGTVCYDPCFHEDVDLAAHLSMASYNVIYDATLRVEVSARRLENQWAAYYLYVRANSRTYAAHGLKGRYFMYPIELFTLVFYPLLRVLYRGYDPEAGRYSLRKMFRPAYKQRVSPVADTTS